MVTPMVARRPSLSASSFTDFGTLLGVLRRVAMLTQRELGIVVGYSEAQICRLEQGGRLPAPAVVAALFLPGLRLGTEPDLAARLLASRAAWLHKTAWFGTAPASAALDRLGWRIANLLVRHRGH